MFKYIAILFTLFLGIQTASEPQCRTQVISNSPIDIAHYTSNSLVTYPANPFFVLNSTIYYHLNDMKFQRVGTSNDIILDILGNNKYMGKAYTLIGNSTYTYTPVKIALKMYSEHSFHGVTTDLELQIYHKIEGNLPKFQDFTIPNVTGSTCHYPTEENYKYMAISVRFSAVRNKKSKNNFIEQLVKINPDQKTNILDDPKNYEFERVYDLDFNTFTNFDDPYYHYLGEATINDGEFTESTPVHWIILKRVQDMSKKEYRNLQLAMTNALGGNFLNAKIAKYQSINRAGVIYDEYFNSGERIEIEFQWPRSN